MMYKFRLFSIALLAAVVCLAQQEVKTVHGRGRNADYRTAVYEALVQAMSQVQGVSLQDSRDAFMDSLKQQKSTKSGEDSIDEVRELLKQSVSAKTKGLVLSYDITEERHDKAVGLWYVELEAKVPGRYQIGLPANNRRRMIVMPFRSLTGQFNFFGKQLQMSSTCESVARHLNEDLTQTRRFTMLDREFNAETQAELSRLNMENASADDLGRFNQLLVTDYMVIGTVKLFDSPVSAYTQDPYTGMASANDGPFMEISYRVVLVPTSQLKWAGTIIVPYSSCCGGSVDVALASGIATASREVCHDIINNIYPMRVTAKTTFEIVFNQGGSNIREGEVFDIFSQGEAIKDVSSGETLGAPEEQIARVQITRVTPKMSYATVVEGTPFADIPVGCVARRAKFGPGLGPRAGAASAVKVAPGGTVTPPWQK